MNGVHGAMVLVLMLKINIIIIIIIIALMIDADYKSDGWLGGGASEARVGAIGDSCRLERGEWIEVEIRI